MEFAQVLIVSWRRRGWMAFGVCLAIVVGIGTGYRLQLSPLALKAKSLSTGQATTQLLVDTNRTALGEVTYNFNPLAQRATVYAAFMNSEPVRRAIAAQVGVPENAIVTQSSVPTAIATVFTEPSANQRAQQILRQNLGYRLSFAADPNEPTITISAQAQGVIDALRLANGAAAGFIGYMKRIEDRQSIPAADRVTIRQLGGAEGGVSGGGVKVSIIALAFGGVLLVWVLLVVFFSSVADNLRAIREAAAREGSAEQTVT